MPRGGARSKAGKMPDRSSEAFQSRVAGMFALPAEGYKRKHPKFPLPPYETDSEKPADHDRVKRLNAREQQLWNELWHLPQGYGWSRPQYKYLQPTVAQYVRLMVVCEAPDARSSDRVALLRFADNIGLTPQGLRQLGWIISDPVERPARTSSASRSNVVPFRDPRQEWEAMNDDEEEE